MFALQTLPLFVLFAYSMYMYTAIEMPSLYNLNGNEHISTIYQRCTGTCNKKYCKISVSCRPINRTSKLLSLDIHLQEGVKIEAPVTLKVETFKKFRTEYRPHMFKYTVELCKLISLQNHFIFEFLYINRTTSTLFDPCPISGHRFISPKITSTWAPTLVPLGEWRIEFVNSKIVDGLDEEIVKVTLYVLVKANDAIGADEF